MKSDKSKCLASLAVFRELHDSKKDVYEIISAFLQEVIASSAKYQFNLREISQLLNETYDFNIPEAVIKSSLNRLIFLTKSMGKYTVSDISKLDTSSDITSKHSELHSSNEHIINTLFRYIEKEKDINLTAEDKAEVVHSFCNFILDDSIFSNYAKFISAFIVSNKSDTEFTKQLETIKEGVVLYSGIKYNSNINEIGSWNNELTIYLDMEILFNLAGYNGDIYKQTYDDFYFFVKKINMSSVNKVNKKVIHLKYFKDVKDGIEKFFDSAIYILEGKGTQNPSNTAMTSILDGCKTVSDIITKKTHFFILLKSNGILEDEYKEYFSPENHKYNIEDKEIIKELSELTENYSIENNLKFLNYVSIHRKETSNNNFENIGHILLTGNILTQRIAWHESVKKNGCVPLATNLNFLTNKFWFKLNRGFGSDNYPKSFGIISKAQILLSAELNKSVGKKFEELQRDSKNGKLTSEQAISIIVELRKRAKKPEDIEVNEITSILESISEDSIEKIRMEQEFFKTNASKQKNENTILKERLYLKDKELMTQGDRLLETEKIIKELQEKDRIRNDRIEKIKTILKRISYFIFLIFTAYIGVKLYNLNNKIIGTCLSSVASILAILTFFGIDYRVVTNMFAKMNKKKTA